jgi:Domain of unknown function (DUF4259)
MSAWGTGNFENDDARDWLAGLQSLAMDDLTPILARAADDADYLEAGPSSVAVAAAEVVAALKGAPAENLPREIAAWTSATKNQPTSSSMPELAGLAVRAVDRVRTNSELKELWMLAEGLNEWSAALRELTARLAG